MTTSPINGQPKDGLTDRESALLKQSTNKPTPPKSNDDDGTSQLARSTQKTHDQMIQVGLKEGEGLSNLKSRAFAQSFMSAESRNQDAIGELLEDYGDQRLQSIQASADEQTGGFAPNFTDHKADLKALFSL